MEIIGTVNRIQSRICVRERIASRARIRSRIRFHAHSVPFSLEFFVVCLLKCFCLSCLHHNKCSLAVTGSFCRHTLSARPLSTRTCCLAQHSGPGVRGIACVSYVSVTFEL